MRPRCMLGDVMSDKADLQVRYTPESGLQVVLEVFDRDLIMKDATLTIEGKVEVEDSRPVHANETLHKAEFKIADRETVLDVPAEFFRRYSYAGTQIQTGLVARVKINDSLFFDTKVFADIDIPTPTKPAPDTNAQELVNPHDDWKFSASLQALPEGRRNAIYAAIGIAGFITMVSLIVGWHDQFATPGEHWVLARVNTESTTIEPLGLGAVLAVFLLIGSAFFVFNQLKRYMRIKLKPLPERIVRDTDCVVADLVSGRLDVDLENAKLRIVACNMECGQYVRGSGSNRRTISFSTPFRAVTLFEKEIGHVTKGSRIEDYLNESFSFTPMFDALLPPNMISETHGVNIHWEVQFLHDQLKDHELEGPTECFSYDDFLPA